MAKEQGRLSKILQKELKSKGAISGLSSAIGKRAMEGLDPRNLLFGGKGVFSQLGQKAFGKGYSATPSVKQVSTSKLFEEIRINTEIIAKNSLAIPVMARDINVIKQNIVKMAGVKAKTKVEKGFKKDTSPKKYTKAAKLADTKDKKPVTTGTAPKAEGKDESGGLPVLPKGLADFLDSVGKMAVTAGSIAAIGIGIGGFLAGVGAGVWVLDKLGGPDKLKVTLIALAEGLNAFSAQSLLALGAVGMMGAGAAAIGKGTSSAVGAGGMLGAFGLGLGGFIAGLALGVSGAEAISSPDVLTSWLQGLAAGLNAFDVSSLAALGAVAAMGAIAGGAAPGGIQGKVGAVLGAGGMLASVGLGMGGFIAAISLGIEGAGLISSPNVLTSWLVALAEGLNAFNASSLAALGGLVAGGAMIGAVSAVPGVGALAALGAIAAAGGMLISVGIGMGYFIAALGIGSAVASFLSSPQALEGWMTSFGNGLKGIGEINGENLLSVAKGLIALGPGIAAFFASVKILEKTTGDEKTQEKFFAFFTKIVTAVMKPLESIDTEKIKNLGDGIKSIVDGLKSLAGMPSRDVEAAKRNASAARPPAASTGGGATGGGAAPAPAPSPTPSTTPPPAVSSGGAAPSGETSSPTPMPGESAEGRAPTGTPERATPSPGVQGSPRRKTEGIVFHHTGGRSVQGAISTLKQRGLAYHYMIDRDGKIIPFMADNAVAYHAGNTDKNRKFGNWNTIGIAAAANDNNDVTPEQQASAAKLAKELSQKYGFDIQNVFGHGQVSSQKLPTEGVALVDAVKSGGGTATQVPPAPTTGAVVGSASSEVATGHRQQMTVDRGSQTTVVAPTNNTVNKSKTVRRNDFVDTDMSVAASMGMGA